MTQQQTTDYRGGTLSVRVYYNHGAKILTVEGRKATSITTQSLCVIAHSLLMDHVYGTTYLSTYVILNLSSQSSTSCSTQEALVFLLRTAAFSRLNCCFSGALLTAAVLRWGRGELPPNLSVAPKSLVTAAVCSSKTCKQLYRVFLED